MQNQYIRIGNRLMLDEPEPRWNGGDANEWQHYLIELGMYNDRPSYPINPSDDDCFKEGERYEEGKDFQLHDTPVDIRLAEGLDGWPKYYERSTEKTAFAIHKANDCSKHKKDLFGETDMKKVAEAIGDLHYETLAVLLDQLSSKLYLDAAKDRADGRKMIAASLEYAASPIHEAHIFIEHAWQISKPFMESK
jgi:hypothetical protein